MKPSEALQAEIDRAQKAVNKARQELGGIEKALVVQRNELLMAEKILTALERVQVAMAPSKPEPGVPGQRAKQHLARILNHLRDHQPKYESPRDIRRALNMSLSIWGQFPPILGAHPEVLRLGNAYRYNPPTDEASKA